MAVAIGNPVLGYLAFTAVKAVGYTGAAFFINWKLQSNALALKVGFLRLLIGMFFGVGVWGAIWLFGEFDIHSGSKFIVFAYIALLAPVRFVEWHILFNMFYKNGYFVSQRKFLWLLVGTVFSYILDIPAAIGWFQTSGFWVC